MSMDRDPKSAPNLDDDSDRGDLSKEGFGDYDKEFHPAEVEIEREAPSTKDVERKPATERVSPVEHAARDRFEVHFRMMKLRI